MNKRWIRDGVGGLAFVGPGFLVAFIGGFSVAFGFALCNQERLSRAAPSDQHP